MMHFSEVTTFQAVPDVFVEQLYLYLHSQKFQLFKQFHMYLSSICICICTSQKFPFFKRFQMYFSSICICICTSQKLQLFKQLQMYLSSSCIWNLSLSSVGCTSKKFSLIVFGCRSVCYHILNIILVFEIFGNLHLPHCSTAVSTRTACHSEFYA